MNLHNAGFVERNIPLRIGIYATFGAVVHRDAATLPCTRAPPHEGKKSVVCVVIFTGWRL